MKSAGYHQRNSSRMSTTSNPDDVSTALGLLRDSLSSEEERIRSEGAKAMQTGDYDRGYSPHG